MKKIIFINGNVAVDGLALSSYDEFTLINNVNVVFHCAASVRFNDPLKDVININTAGTLRLLKLAQRMKNLKIFLYMSTAFCQSHQSELKEVYYPSNLDAFAIINLTEELDNESLDQLERKL
jgi:alcohol-forming fatty acyl-CoA reductase